MTIKRFWLALVGLGLILGMVGCQSQEGVLRISEAYMAFDEAGAYPTKAYAPTDTFFCMVTALDAPEGTTLKAVWYAVNAKGTPRNTKIEEIETTTGEAVVPIVLTNQGPWPTGSYKVEIYLNGVLDRTIKFKVK